MQKSVGDRRTTTLAGYQPARICTARAAHEHSERRFSRLLRFSFTSDDAPAMLSSGPRHAGWSVALVRSTGHRIDLGDDDKVSLLFPYRGRIGVARAGEQMVADPDAMLCVAPGQRTTYLSSGYLGVLIQVPIVAFENAMDDLRGARSPRRAAMTRLGAGHSATLAAHDVIRALEAKRHLPLNDDNAWHGLLASTLRALAAGDAADHGRDRLPLSLRHVQAAEGFMRANLHRPLAIEDIARTCGVGPRALQFAFRRFRRGAPMEVLNDLRMRHAKALLAADGPPPSVTQVAMDCGFTHLGRFSVAYRSTHGERPSTTARQRRSPP